MNWLWKDKTQQEKTKLEFSAKNRRRDLINRTVKVHLELQLEYPESMDIVQAIREVKTSFDLPMGIEMLDAHLAHVEILGDPDV